MCGIFGILKNENASIEFDKLEAMSKSLYHRGPDAKGFWVEGSIGLGHRRLSIIDLSDKANQPMVNSNGRLQIVFNGEIYNYRELKRELTQGGAIFRTNSDTEVILELFTKWGTDAIPKLRGMFAFALWDSKSKKLYLVRDRLGIKPLYYSISSSQVTFASEIKAVLYGDSSLRTINSDALWKYFRLFTVPLPDTIVKGIKKLEPGTFLTIDRDLNVAVSTYWNLKEFCSVHDDFDENSALIELQSILNDTICHHLIADVEIGSFLSGGLDSSLVTSLMKHALKKRGLATFSVSFPGLKEFDEGKYSEIVSKHLQTNHSVVYFNETFLNELDRIIWHCDEPFAIASSFALYQLSKSASENLKVVLTGDGGDEIFAGYSGFLAEDGNLLLRSIFGQLGKQLTTLNRISRINNRKIDILAYKLLRRGGSAAHYITEQQSNGEGWSIAETFNPECIDKAFSSWEERLYPLYYSSLEEKDELTRRLYAEAKTRLVDEMLTKTDRMTMAHSLEARVPLLDHLLVEYAFSLSSKLKIRNKAAGHIEQKYLLKKAAEPYLPSEIVYRKKKGFDIPFTRWMQKEDIFGQFYDAIHNGKLVNNKILNQRSLEKLAKSHKNGETDRSTFFWALGIFEIWNRRFEKDFGKFSII